MKALMICLFLGVLLISATAADQPSNKDELKGNTRTLHKLVILFIPSFSILIFKMSYPIIWFSNINTFPIFVYVIKDTPCKYLISMHVYSWF